MPPITLVIMAAGAGSRFGGPKQLDPIGPGDARLLEYAVYDAIRAGIARVVLIVRAELEPAFRDAIRAWPPGIQIDLVAQRLDDVPAGVAVGDRAKPWGTTQAVLAARHVLQGPFIVINADDFYGRDTYRLAAEHAHASAVTIVGMRLDRTLSPSGGVTRAVCEVHDGAVVCIDEVRDVRRDGSAIRGRLGAMSRTFTGAELVSMNCWVMPHAALSRLADRFAAFVVDPGRPGDAECMLPETMNDLIRAGEISVRALESPGPWFGLTYAADRDAVSAGLRRLVAEGTYPERLWARLASKK